LDLTEDFADARSNARHQSPGSHRNETRHQGVLDQVLALIVFHKPDEIYHDVSLIVPFRGFGD
jgi:hypothetical protein